MKDNEPSYIYRSEKAYQLSDKEIKGFKDCLINILKDGECEIEESHIKAIEIIMHITGVKRIENIDDLNKWISLGVINDQMYFTDQEFQNVKNDGVVFVVINILHLLWEGKVIQIWNEKGDPTYIPADKSDPMWDVPK